MNFICVSTKGVKKRDWSSRSDHNTRKVQPPNADPARSSGNVNMSRFRGMDLMDKCEARYAEAGVRPTKHSETICQEIILSASPEYFRPGDRDDPATWGKYDSEKLEAFQKAALKWTQKEFGKENVLQMNVHVDERTPHIHFFVTPILEVEVNKRRTKQQIADEIEPEKVKRTKYNRGAMFNPDKLEEYQDSFGMACEHLGLRRGIKKDVTKENPQNQHDYHHSLARAQKLQPPRMDMDFEDFSLRKKKFLESNESYSQHIFKSVKKTTDWNKSLFDREMKEMNQAKAITAHENTRLKDENKKLRERLGIGADIDEKQFQAFLKYQKDQEKQQQQNPTPNRPSTTYAPQ